MEQLKDELRQRGLPTNGLKAALVQRLKEEVGPNVKVIFNIIIKEHEDDR